MVEVIDIVRSLVNMLREEITISNITALPQPNRYTFEVNEIPQLLTKGQTLSIGNYTCEVLEINTLTLTVLATGNITGEILATLKAPYLLLGYWTEIANEISQFGKSKTLSNQKFPLVAFNGIDITKESKSHYDGLLPLTFYIIAESEPNLTTENRFDTTFKEVLNPIYNALIEAVEKSYYFEANNKSLGYKIEINNLPYLGSLGKNQNQINEVVDAIEVKITGLNIRKCLTMVETYE
jgi:hypothetical protein